MSAFLSTLKARYYSIERLALKYFFYVQQDHKLNETGIKTLEKIITQLDLAATEILST